MRIEQRLEELGLKAAPARVNPNRVGAVKHGDLVYLSGKTPVYSDGKPRQKGKIGSDLTLEEGYEGARQTAVNLLGALKDCIGDLDQVTQVVKLLCMVNTADGFYEAHKVADGASDLLVELYGEKGMHARSAVGIACPGGNNMIEIEMIVAVE